MIPIEKENTRIDKNGYYKKYISHTLKFIYSARFMASLLSNLKEFIELNVNSDMMIKNAKLVELSISFENVL